MPTKKSEEPKYVTQKFVKKEINCLDAKIDQVEKHLDAKIDGAVQSMKDYTDSRFNQLNNRMNQFDLKIENVEYNILKKIDTSVNGLVNLIERSMGMNLELKEQVENHEQRIIKLEERASQ